MRFTRKKIRKPSRKLRRKTTYRKKMLRKWRGGSSGPSTKTVTSVPITTKVASVPSVPITTKVASVPSVPITTKVASVPITTKVASVPNVPITTKVANVPSATSGQRGPVDLYFSVAGGTSEGASGIILAAHSPTAPIITNTPLGINGWMINTRNSKTVFNRDQIKFPLTFPKDVKEFTCSTWNGTAWTPRKFVNLYGTNGFSLTTTTGASLYGATKAIPTSINLANTVVTGLWDGFNFGTRSNNLMVWPPAGSKILYPTIQVNVKISFIV